MNDALPISIWVQAAVLLGTLLSCGESTPPRAPERSSEPAAEPAPPSADELEARWDRARTGLDVEGAGAPSRAVRWSAPGCELRYAFRARAVVQQDGVDVSHMHIRGGFRWKPSERDGADVEIVNEALTLSHGEDGYTSPGMTQAAGTLATIYLATDGSTWTERDGPTALWSAYGSWPGPVVFFPALPTGSTPGSERAWEIRLHTRGSGMRVEVARGTTTLPQGTEAPEPRPTEFPATSRVERWIDIDRARAAVLRARWELRERTQSGGLDVQVDGTENGLYVITDRGRLIFAATVRRTNVEMGPLHQVHTIDSEARLVSSCDGGPVLPPFPEAPTPPERASLALQRLRNAVASEQRADALALFDPDILSARSEDAVWDALRGCVATYGATSLGLPEFAPAPPQRGDIVELDVPGSLVRTGQASQPVQVRAQVHVSGSDARIRSLEVVQGTRTLVEISSEGIRWDPPGERPE
jgi:hypothetical protein